MKPECAARLLLGYRARDEHVARRGADAFSHPIGHAHREHVPGRRGEGDERSNECRQAIPEKHERLLARRAIGDVARGELQHARDGVGHSFDEADERRRRSERRAFFAPLNDGVHLLPGIDLDGFVSEVVRVAPAVQVITPLYREPIGFDVESRRGYLMSG